MPKDKPSAASVSSSEVAFRGMIWNVKREVFEFAPEILTREFVDHPGAVAVVAVDDQNRVLLIRQYRHPVGEYLWEIPAGLLDIEGEPGEVAARRELLEETGYEAASLTPLIEFFTTPGGSNERISIFLAGELTVSNSRPAIHGEESQMLVEWVDFDLALASILASEIKSPSAVVGLMALALRGRS